MGKAVGKREGESKLRDGDMRGAGRKPEKGWKGRQGKERRERKGAGPTAWLSITGKLLFACLTKKEGKEICGSLCCCKAPQVLPASLPRKHHPPVLKGHCSPVPDLVESKMRVQLLAPWVRMGREGVPRQHWSFATTADQAKADEQDRRMQLDGESRMLRSLSPSWAQLHWDWMLTLTL